MANPKANQREIVHARVEYLKKSIITACVSGVCGFREIRTELATRRTARVLLCVYREHLVALHGFIKKLGQRQKRISDWRGSARRSWSNEQETHGIERR